MQSAEPKFEAMPLGLISPGMYSENFSDDFMTFVAVGLLQWFSTFVAKVPLGGSARSSGTPKTIIGIENYERGIFRFLHVAVCIVLYCVMSSPKEICCTEYWF